MAPSPNLRGPQFSRLLYEATLPEDAPKFTPVVTVVAKDPEEAGPVKYSFTEDEIDDTDYEQGSVENNSVELFEIEETTGTVRVMKELDRYVNTTDTGLLDRLTFIKRMCSRKYCVSIRKH